MMLMFLYTNFNREKMLSQKGQIIHGTHGILFTICYHFCRGKSYQVLIKDMTVPFVCICLQFLLHFNSVDRVRLLFTAVFLANMVWLVRPP